MLWGIGQQVLPGKLCCRMNFQIKNPAYFKRFYFNITILTGNIANFSNRKKPGNLLILRILRLTYIHPESKIGKHFCRQIVRGVSSLVFLEYQVFFGIVFVFNIITGSS